MSPSIARREFITSGGAALVWPFDACAQAIRRPVRLGFLPLGSPSNAYDQSLVDAFRSGLRQVGLVEDRDIVLDTVWIRGDPEQAVAELLQRGATMLVPCGSTAAVAARRQTLTIPIVFVSVGNPIGMGLVESLPRPGRNVTGFSDLLGDLGGKLVDLARDLSKPQAPLDYLWHMTWPDGRHRFNETDEAAQSIGMPLRSHGLNGEADVGRAIADAKASGATVLIVQPSPFTYQRRAQIIASAIDHGLATIFAWPIAAREGALIGYGPDYVHMYRRAPFYVDRIIKGTKPADLPVEQPTRVEMVVNLKTAKVLGIDVPLPLLIRAEELVE